MVVTCTSCEARLADGARFCPSCGARQPEEDPGAVLQYREALRALGGRREAWAEEELATLRRELQIRPATHARLVAELAPVAPRDLPVSVWIDAASLTQLRAGEQGLLRVRVVNESGRALRRASLRCRTTGIEVEACTRDLLGPGEEEVLALLMRPTVAGHHPLTGTIEVTPLRGEAQVLAIEDIAFRVATATALQQSIHIDARSQRVGIFENIGASEKGGLVGAADWRPIALRVVTVAPVAAVAALPPIGRRGPGVVVATGHVLTVALDGVEGALVDLDDPELRGRLAPGDRLQVTVIGHDGRDRLVLSTRAPATAPSHAAPSHAAPSQAAEARVGPGGSLADALRSGATRIVVTGTHIGPFVVDRAVEIAGEGATLEAARGPVLRLSADVVVRGLTVRGAAPAGAYAIDAIAITTGRCVLDGVTASSDAPGNLTPGRALAVAGTCRVEVRGCVLRDAGIGIAIDVSWTGFATDTAAGASVRVYGSRFENVGTGVALAGAGRELHVARCTFTRVADAAVSLLRGASATVEDCVVSPSALHAEAGAHLVTRGNAP